MRFSRILGPPLLVIGLVLTACTGPSAGGPGAPAPPGHAAATAVLDQGDVAAAVHALGTRPGKDLHATRLADGLVPPTNRWFSGLVFGDKPLPVFPLPLSFGLTESGGFGFGVPKVTTTAKTIMGGHAPIVQVGVPGSPTWQVTSYDEMSVVLTARAASGLVGEVRLVQGSPFVTYTAASAQRLTTNMAFTRRGDLWVADDGTDTYAVDAPGATIAATSIDVPAGGRVSWFPVPEGGSAEALAGLASDPVTATSATYATGATASTTLRWTTAHGGPTAFATLPHQQSDAPGATCDLGTYRSILGTMRVCSGNELTWEAPVYPARAQLDLSRVDEATRRQIRTQLAADVAAAQPYPADTYFGGKALYRDAQLYTIARQVGDTANADALKKRVSDQLLLWARPRGCDAQQPAFCFGYDEANRGIVGNTPSFGSDEFNDHHFHYGYFLYAAGVVAADDAELRKQVAPVMDLLAADIAGSPASDLFPQRRNFDAYAGHSWASGTAPFADGNNQESSSEAVNAWAGLALWARASDNEALLTQATWLHALEAQTARAYWTDFDPTQPVYEGYGHTIVPLNFGGKRDYATWFSAEPAAALAILLLPVGPSSDHLAGDPERIRRNVAEGTGTKGFDQQYGDYLLMYSALAGEEDRRRALEVAPTLSGPAIDDGNTRTYLLAFLAALKE